MINIKNQSEPLEIVGKGIVYSENETLYFKNEAGTVYEINTSTPTATSTITKTDSYTLTTGDCDGTKKFIFSKKTEFNVDNLICTLPNATTSLSTTIKNECNNTLILRLQGDDVLYCNGQTYDSLHDFYLNYSNQEIVIYSISASEYIGLTTNQDYSIKKIYISAKDQKGYLLTETGNLYFWGLNYAGAFTATTPSNFNDNGNVVGADTYIPFPMTNENLLKIDVRDFWFTYTSPTTFGLFVLDNQGTLYSLSGGGTTATQIGRTVGTNDGLLPIAGHNFCSVHIGKSHIVGLRSDGSAWSWGLNTQGQLGDGTVTSRLTPVSVCGNHTFCQIHIGGYNTDINPFTIGIKDDGSTWSWGVNTYGVLGDNSVTSRLTPVSVVGNHTFTQIVTGGFSVLGLKSDGSAWSWGINDVGQLGDGTTTSRRTPVSVCGNHTFTQIFANGTASTSFGFAFGLKSDGSLWSWGYNGSGQLGDGTTTSRLTPVSVCGNHTFCNIFLNNDANYGNIKAIKSDGTLWSWGLNRRGELGINVSRFDTILTPTQVCISESVVKVYTQDVYKTPSTQYGYPDIIKTANNRYYAWTANFNNILNLKNSDYPSKCLKLVNIPSNCNIQDVQYMRRSPRFVGYILKTDGTLFSWGSVANTSTEIGGIVDNSVSPYYLDLRYSQMATHTFCQVSAGNQHTLGLKADGTLWSWGSNTYGQLGDNSTTLRYTPVSVVGGHTFCQIATGYYDSNFLTYPFSLGLKSDGSVWSWGENQFGQLGDNTVVNKSTPITVLGNHTFCQISTGYSNVIARKNDGSLWSWGRNTLGAVGDGTTTHRCTPFSVCGNHTFCSIYSGVGYNLAVRTDSTIWSWGSNTYGNLGDNTAVSKLEPTLVSDIFCAYHIPITNLNSSTFVFSDNLTPQKRYNWFGRSSGISEIDGYQTLNLFAYSQTSVSTPTGFVNQTYTSFRKLYYFDDDETNASLPSALVIDTNNQLWKWGFGYNQLFNDLLSHFPDETPFHTTPVEIVKFFNVK